jgi:tetratricopeptide (TPR) repeat protein
MTMLDSHHAHIAKLEARFGPHSEEVAVALNTLARLIVKYEESVDAVPYFERCIAIREALKGPASILGDLDAWMDQGNLAFKAREPFMQKRIAAKASVFGELDPDVVAACDALAADYLHLKRFAEARPLLERSLAIREQLDGGPSAAVAAALETLADVCRREGRRKEADRYLERCVAVADAAFGASSREVATMLVSLAVACLNAGHSQTNSVRFDLVRKARPMVERALAITDALDGPDSLAVQKALEAVAQACLTCGAFREAEPLLKRLLSIFERAYGENAAALLWILADLAEGYASERSGEAEPMLERGFDVLRKFLDARRPVLRRSIADLSGTPEVLYGRSRDGLLEKLVRASETTRSNLRQRWGASG